MASPTVMDIKMRAVAARLIAKFGKSVSLTTLGTNSYDVTTGDSTPASTKTKTLKGIVRAPTQYEYDSGTAASGDSYFIVSALGLITPPDLGDKFVIDGATWKIVSVEPTFSGEQVAIYTCHLRT